MAGPFQRLWLALVLLAGVATHLWAQEGAALLIGTARDETGLVLPGVAVTAQNQDTGVVRTTVTDERGRYRIPALVPGAYRITAEIAGFQTVSLTDVVLRLGQEATIDFTLQVQGVEETVTVTGESPLIETRRSEIAQSISEQQIQDLPVNTREWINLATLAAGVSQDNVRGFYNNANIGGGSRWYSNAFVVDGVVNTWAEQGEPRQNFPMDSIAEFKVTQSLFKAEHGLATGGLLTAVTKSGTNEVQGSAFVYGRDKALNSRGFFEREKPDFRRYQFGGSFGGPIVEDKTHFFASYERTELDHFFTVNTGGAFPQEEGTFPRNDFRQMFTIRLDHTLGPTQSLMFRYAQEDERQEDIGAGGTRVQGSGFTQHIPRRSAVGKHTWIPNDRVLNEVRVQYAFAAYQIWPGGSSQSFTENGVWDADRFAALDQVIIRPSAQFGYAWADVGPEVRLQVRNDFSYFVTEWAGEHNFKMGFDFSYVDFSDDWSGNPRGTYSFSTDRPFDPSDPETHPFLFTAFAPESLLRAAQFGSFPAEWNTRLKTQYYAAYFQDDWQPAEKLTLNLGLRYDLQSGVFNKDLDRSISPFIEPDERGDFNNFGPRAGFAYDLAANGRSVLRGGYGLYYDNIRTLPQFDERRNFQYIFLFIPDPPYPDPFGGRNFLEFASTAVPSITVLANDYVNPYSHQYNVGISQQIGSDLALSADFNYTRGLAYRSSRDINYFPTPELRALGIRPNPDFARITENGNENETKYRAMLLRFEKRYSNRWQFLASYTLAKAEDFPDGLPADHFDIGADWGPDQTDRRHRVVLSGIITLPYAIQLSGVADLRSSLPFNVLAGTDLNRDTIGSDRPPGVTRNTGCRDLNLAAVNAYRTGIGLASVSESDVECPGYASVDLRGSKRFSVGAAKSIEFFVQAFNILNRANFDTPVGNLRSASFGKVVSARAPRQVELAVRFHF